MLQPTFFLDRDGTIIEEKHYLSKLEDIVLLRTVAPTLKSLQQKGYRLLLMTNQSGVAKGIITENFVKTCFQKINQLLAPYAVEIEDCFYCPHHPQGNPPYNINCNCRKPKIGMVEQAQKKYAIDMKKSWLIGDKLSDLELAKNLNIASALVLTGYGKQQKIPPHSSAKILNNFSDILQFI